MSYELLNTLYFSEAANADLSSPASRQLLHIETPLERLIVFAVDKGMDVVLTGNPGDGKSHLVRTLLDRRIIDRAVVEPDLSARATEEVLESWRAAAQARQPFVLCANEGPLTELLSTLRASRDLKAIGEELSQQLGHLMVYRESELPPPPSRAMLIDLADRLVLRAELIERAIARVATEDFLPPVKQDATETSAGRNILLMHRSRGARVRLSQAIEAAGSRLGEHVTFRQLWAAIAFAVTRVRKPHELRQELAEDRVSIDTLPLSNLVHPHGRGDLLAAARTLCDVAHVTDPDLDEQLWTVGRPASGEWLSEVAEEIEGILPQAPPPASLWRAGRRDEAFASLEHLKRMVALLHQRGDLLLDELCASAARSIDRADQDLCVEIADGLRSLFLAPGEERGGPEWVREGVPLWIGLSYEFGPVGERPHVAVSSRRTSEFEVLRPRRAPWLLDSLGPLPPIVWFSHQPSGIALAVDSSLLKTFRQAARMSGPLQVPESVQRFMARLAGWEEHERPVVLGAEHAVFLERPRGRILAEAAIKTRGEEASYALG